MYIITIDTSDLSNNARTKLYYAVHGRVRTNIINKKRYVHYYPGFFDNIPYRRIKKNVYICTKVPKVPKEFWEYITIEKTKIKLVLSDQESARNKFKLRYSAGDTVPTNM